MNHYSNINKNASNLSIYCYTKYIAAVGERVQHNTILSEYNRNEVSARLANKI